ncbi:MAG: MiaB/RimO family radical SAM methylthiotransferase [Desulfamplus sp.]|nr:MiaB/RimO family radical SAM methylthiotransferase [Desulfamplus sp.]
MPPVEMPLPAPIRPLPGSKPHSGSRTYTDTRTSPDSKTSLYKKTCPDSKKYSESNACSDRTLHSNPAFHTFAPAVTGSNTRAYLKIQDGCDAFCTYCIVPYARGRSTSMPMNEVIEHLEHLSTKGYKEAILTGIHVGAYGLDLENDRFNPDEESSIIENNRVDLQTKPSLTDLLMKIEYLRPIHRVRLSSIEPKELTDQIISLASRSHVKHTPVLCDHFHIPLQSGDDTILKHMGRPYDCALFADLVTRIHNDIPTAAIGVDILEGFPGESDKAFENTLTLVEKLPVSYLHVFPFSPRKGTPAFDYPDKVDTKTVKKRCAILRTLGTRKKKEFENSQMGLRLESVIQDSTDTQTGKLIAVTSNYLSVIVEGDDGSNPHQKELKRQIVHIELTGRDKNNRLTGKIA